MCPQQNSLGDQELQILHYVTDHAPISVRDVAVQWGETHNLARTTILTVLERLRAKGFLTRKKQAGVWVYAPTTAKNEVLQNVVRDFVHKTLGGQIAPFVAYLTQTRDLSDSELADLKQLVRELEQEPQPGAIAQSRSKPAVRGTSADTPGETTKEITEETTKETTETTVEETAGGLTSETAGIAANAAACETSHAAAGKETHVDADSKSMDANSAGEEGAR